MNPQYHSEPSPLQLKCYWELDIHFEFVVPESCCCLQRHCQYFSVSYFDVKIANHLDREVSSIGRRPLKVMVQVNTSGEISKSCVEPSCCVDLAKYVKLSYLGFVFSDLMTIGIPDYTSTPENFQAVYVLFRNDNAMKLPYFIAIAGFACAIFAICIPHLSALRIWLGFSTFFSLVYIVAAFALSLRDGIKAPPRDYGIPGTYISKICTTIGASASLVFAFNTGMLPEIQVGKNFASLCDCHAPFRCGC